MQYEDFQLVASGVKRIKEGKSRRVEFSVQVTKSPHGELIEGITSNYDVDEMSKHLGGWETRALEWGDVLALGDLLGDALFPGAVRELLLNSLSAVQGQKKNLRLRLSLAGELHNIPWEYALLNRGGGEATQLDLLGLMPDVSIVRHQPATLPEWEIKATLPAQVVVALANALEWKPLDLDTELRDIKEALGQTPQVSASYVYDATPETFLGGMKKAHLFHFAGHGEFKGQMGAEPGTVEGVGAILLDDGDGGPSVLDAGVLAVQLRSLGVRVAVLGACQSGRRDNVNVWSSVATALLKAGLGAVVGMQYNILDESAITFAKTFYGALIAGLTIDEAVSRGRIAIALNDLRGWGTPVLYLRAPDGVIFQEYAAEPALEVRRQELRVRGEQHVELLKGKATAVKINKLSHGSVHGKQVIKELHGEATAVEIGEVGEGGDVSAEQRAGKIESDASMIGVKIDLA